MALKNISYLQIISFIYLFLSLVESIDFKYPAVFNFVDSNSDTGELTAGLGIRLESPNGQSYFRKPSGRFCDGRLLVDFLKGCNFAAAGSTILPATASSVSQFSFGIQVSQFLYFKDEVLELLSKGKNDIAGAFYSRSKDQVLASIPTILSEIETGVKILKGSSVAAKGCDDSSKYISWDGIHYTEAANQYVLSQILTGKYSDPPLSDIMKSPPKLDL
ncbi:hypothetical protein AQUCO_02800249v1 [Aquilegia coerulea]|uniref:GDSL esterase/lipase n=1 Tax=Aquilegia coerulea TaxID=218851 RepID=A0A2G5D4H1_AQUCA|nr:hypothetical protein AQUCO_02800249v1 [Aquilegia coerulea]